jgi:hypothetical protein
MISQHQPKAPAEDQYWRFRLALSPERKLCFPGMHHGERPLADQHGVAGTSGACFALQKLFAFLVDKVEP